MSYPVGWDLVNITGTYIGRDGVPCVGSVTLSSPQLVLRSGTIVPAADIVFELVNGTFSGQIPATDDPNAQPSGWVYTVTENVPGGRQGYQIVAPHTSPGIDLSTVIPVTLPMPPTFGFPYVTLAQLAGTAVGDGAYLIGYQNPASGSVARTVQQQLQQFVNVFDFGAVGNGVTDDSAAFQAAINALPNGGIVKVPPFLYALAAPLVAHAGVLLQGDVLYDNTSNTNGDTSVLPRITWTGGAAVGPMFTIQPSVVGNAIWGGGSVGISWGGGTLVQYGVRFDNTRNARFNGSIDRVTTVGLDVCSLSGSTSNFSEHNVVESLDFIYGVTSATQNATACLFRGNGTTVPSTQQFVGRISALVKNGFSLQIQETDNCQIDYVAGFVDAGGTGGTLRVMNVGAQPADSNLFKYVGGASFFDNGLIGNRVLFYSGEGGSISQLAGTSAWNGSLMDYLNGREYRSHTYALRKLIPISSQGFIVETTMTTPQLASQWDIRAFPKSVVSGMSAILAPDYDCDTGSITGIELRIARNGTAAGNFVFEVKMSSEADGQFSSIVTPEVDQTYTVTAAGQYVQTLYTLTFTTALTTAKNDTLLIHISRNGTSGSDTCADDALFLSARLLWVGVGPQSGPWYIPNW